MMTMLFNDRRDGGRRLAERLERYADHADVRVLGLPRGGVPVAFEVARALHAPLDVAVVRKLGVPGHVELAMGAVAWNGVRVLNEDVVHHLHICREAIERATERELEEVRRREILFRQGAAPIDLRGTIAILVDDGLATGATMRAAVRAVQQESPAHIVVAVPVGAKATCASLEPLVDEVVCLFAPHSFSAVGLWYRDFEQTTDEDVRALLDRASARHRHHTHVAP